MRYKNQGDIIYNDFLEFSKTCKGLDDAETALAIEATFGATDALQFIKATQTPARFKYKLKINIEKAGSFIDLDTLSSQNQFDDFISLAIRKKYFWQKKPRPTITNVVAALNEFRTKAEEIKSQYEWIYNPPITSISAAPGPGHEERADFANYYGGYIEIIYLLTAGDFTKFDEVTNWDTHRFLFQGEYLLRKKIIENIK